MLAQTSRRTRIIEIFMHKKKERKKTQKERKKRKKKNKKKEKRKKDKLVFMPSQPDTH